MNKNLLIVGAGVYSMVVADIAAEMGCFEKIDFVDDTIETTPDGRMVVGKTADMEKLAITYHNMIVAIGDPETRLSLLKKIEEETPCKIAILVSPRAYVAPSAQIGKGSVMEPMAVVHSGAVVSEGCFISAGAVVNHGSMCAQVVHVDCNAVVAGGTIVPAGAKVESGTVFQKSRVEAADLFVQSKKEEIDWMEEHKKKFGTEPNLFDGV